MLTLEITYTFQMKPENKAFLEANQHHGDNARNDYFKNLSGETRVRFEQIMAEEFRPGYRADLFCDKCALEMIKLLYTHFQQWKDAQPKEELVPVGEPIIVHADFPKHEPEHVPTEPTRDTNERIFDNKGAGNAHKNHRRK